MADWMGGMVVRSRSLVLQGTHGALVMPLRGTADMMCILEGLRLRLIRKHPPSSRDQSGGSLFPSLGLHGLAGSAAAGVPVLCGGGGRGSFFTVGRRLSSDAGDVVWGQTASGCGSPGIFHRSVDLESFTAVGPSHAQGTLPEDFPTRGRAVAISQRRLHVAPLSSSFALW